MKNYYRKQHTKYGFKLVKADKSRDLTRVEKAFQHIEPQMGIRTDKPRKHRARTSW